MAKLLQRYNIMLPFFFTLLILFVHIFQRFAYAVLINNDSRFTILNVYRNRIGTYLYRNGIGIFIYYIK